ncbi:Uma2 family endonuclease [soil metagenome]
MSIVATLEKPEEVELVQPWRVSREDFYRIADLGVFGENRAEWLDGEIYVSPPPGNDHSNRTDDLNMLLIRRLGDVYRVRNGSGFVTPRAELAPDFSLIPLSEFDRSQLPRTATVAIEVSRSTLSYDRDTKSVHYAEAGVEQYWILDIVGLRVIAFESPVPEEGAYRIRRVLTEGETLTVPGVNVTFTVQELLGEEAKMGGVNRGT